MIALGGPTLKPKNPEKVIPAKLVSMIALGGPTLKPVEVAMVSRPVRDGFNDSTGRAYTETLQLPFLLVEHRVSMIALGGPTLKPYWLRQCGSRPYVSMIALGGPTLKHDVASVRAAVAQGFNDSTGRAYTETQRQHGHEDRRAEFQ